MLTCNNAKCLHCKRDYTGELKCTIEPMLVMAADTVGADLVVCGTFQERQSKYIPEIYPARNKAGLYPGQIGYSRDVPERVISTPSEQPDEVEECDT